jgi:L-alanine-DL-glutamate epimerase-like enolase superfamily enzyme
MSYNRRNFLRQAGLGGLAAGMIGHTTVSEEISYHTRMVSRYSAPSDLKITDLRVAVLTQPRIPLIRIDTNQGITGYGEVRDGGSPTYALFLKSRLLGKNPCNIEGVFRELKQFGGHARLGGGVSGVEMALWDLTGKAYHIPVYQLLGGKHREQIRLYSDTTASEDPAEFGRRMKARQDMGYTFMKMDFGINMLRNIPGALVNGELLQEGRNRENTAGHYNMTEHPFTRIQITDKGIARLCEYVAAVRNAIGYDIPLAADHFGHIDVNSCIRLGEALEPYQLAWVEDMVPWYYTDMWKQITQALNTPTLTGEDIYLKEEFIKLVDAGAVDMIHPDLATAGGILETKKIGDYAEERGVAMAMHFAGSPVSFMANVHCAAATRNFVALEHHSVDNPWWEDIVTGIAKPIVQDGYVTVPASPGLGVELVEQVITEHMDQEVGYFKPTPEWDKERSWDRIWS